MSRFAGGLIKTVGSILRTDVDTVFSMLSWFFAVYLMVKIEGMSFVTVKVLEASLVPFNSQ